MSGILHVAALGAMSIGVVAIAAVLWLEMRRDGRRRRLVQNVASILREEDPRRGEEQFKRVA
jgi:hypothetical protein